jgi:prevent-host-death family protein
MSNSEKSKPIGYLLDNIERVIDEITASGEPMIITQNGEAMFVVQDILSYQKTQETLALLKLLAMGSQQIKNGQFSSAEDFFAELDAEDDRGL